MMAGIAERKTARSDEALVRVEGNGDNFGNFRCVVHEYGARGHLILDSETHNWCDHDACLSQKVRASARTALFPL
jgi:hypothetical protein